MKPQQNLSVCAFFLKDVSHVSGFEWLTRWKDGGWEVSVCVGGGVSGGWVEADDEITEGLLTWLRVENMTTEFEQKVPVLRWY